MKWNVPVTGEKEEGGGKKRSLAVPS